MPAVTAPVLRHRPPLRRRARDVRRRLRTTPLVLGAVGMVAVAVMVGLGADEGPPQPDLDRLVAEARRPPDASWCAEATSASGLAHCVGGTRRGERTVVLVGDDQALSWQYDLHAVAAEMDLRLVAAGRVGCPLVPVALRRSEPEGEQRCEQHRRAVRELLDELRPDLVVVAHGASYLGRIVGPDGTDAGPRGQAGEWRRGSDRLLTELGALAPVAVIRAGPAFRDDPVACLERTDDLDTCAAHGEEAFARTQPLRAATQQAVARHPGVVTFDVLEAACEPDGCPLVRDGALAYVDASTLSPGFTATQRDALRTLLSQGLAGRGR